MRQLHVYVLVSLKDNNFYIGTTNDLRRRVFQYNSGSIISTRLRRPFKLIFFETFIHPGDAMRRERYFKSTKGRTTLRLMLRQTLELQSKN